MSKIPPPKPANTATVTPIANVKQIKRAQVTQEQIQAQLDELTKRNAEGELTALILIFGTEDGCIEARSCHDMTSARIMGTLEIGSFLVKRDILQGLDVEIE